MTYPPGPQGNPNDGYGYPDPNAAPGAYPQQQPQYGSPEPGYGSQPPNYGSQQPNYGAQPPYGSPAVPQQPQPMHDGTSQMPGYGEPPASYNLEPSVSAPPTSPGMMGPHTQPMGQPMSGAPAYGPVSGVPASGGAYPAQPLYPDPGMGGPTGPAKPKKGVAVPILASLLALAVIAAGVFIGLYFDKSGKLDKSEKLAASRQETLTTTQSDLETTKTNLQNKADELTKAQQELRGTQADSTEAKRQRDVIGSCLKLLFEALDASANNDRTTMNNKLAEMEKPCNEAQVLLGI